MADVKTGVVFRHTIEALLDESAPRVTARELPGGGTVSWSAP